METEQKDMSSAVRETVLDGLNDLEPDTLDGAELHNRLFNEDYFVIGYYNAEQYLDSYGSFQAIGKVQEYEQDNFGEVTTDLSDSEKVCNMLAYVLGEELLSYSDTLRDAWDGPLSAEDIEAIKEELSL